MAAPKTATRYDAEQLVAAIDKARGDGRYFLVMALIGYPGAVDREAALAQAVEKDVRAFERQMMLAELAALNPTEYMRAMIETGLRSRSIDVQQMAIAVLPSLVGTGLDPSLNQVVEGWLRRRLKNPRRTSTWAIWEIPGIALALLPSYGSAKVLELLDELEPLMQPEERPWLSALRSTATEAEFKQLLDTWDNEAKTVDTEPDTRDPTADIEVDRVMKRLGYRPRNPESTTYDPFPVSDVSTFEFPLGSSPDN